MMRTDDWCPNISTFKIFGLVLRPLQREGQNTVKNSIEYTEFFIS